MFENLTSIELFLNANFYAQHPYFLTLVEEQNANSAKNLLPLSVPMTSVDTNLTNDALVKEEAISNLEGSVKPRPLKITTLFLFC